METPRKLGPLTFGHHNASTASYLAILDAFEIVMPHHKHNAHRLRETTQDLLNAAFLVADDTADFDAIEDGSLDADLFYEGALSVFHVLGRSIEGALKAATDADPDRASVYLEAAVSALYTIRVAATIMEHDARMALRGGPTVKAFTKLDSVHDALNRISGPVLLARLTARRAVTLSPAVPATV